MRTRILTCVLAVTAIAGCDSPLDTDPSDAIPAETALGTARAIELAVHGAYRQLEVGALYNRDLLVYPDLYADNLTFTGTFDTDRVVSQRNVPTQSLVVSDLWQEAYEGVGAVNNILAAIPQVDELSDDERAQYRGEALFIRALDYVAVLHWFGGVPIVTEPTWAISEESLVLRNTAEEVYAFIEADLEEARTLLPAERVDGRATQGAVNALLARVYLDEGKHAEARDRAAEVIDGGAYALVASYDAIFATQNSVESIFELQYSVNNQNSLAFWFFPQSLGGRWGFAPSLDLYNAYEPGDTRRDASIAVDDGDRFGIKYFRIANGDDNVPVLRLAEMYLIRAEANTRLGATAALVRADIDAVRTRSGLAPLPASVTSQADLLDAVLQERRVEFAMEGRRFFDLRRMGRAEDVLSIPAHRLLFPIPQPERDVNPNLEQNPGY